MTASRAAGDEAASTAFRPFHAWITLLAGLAFLGNGMDLSIISFALPGMRAEWQLSPVSQKAELRRLSRLPFLPIDCDV